MDQKTINKYMQDDASDPIEKVINELDGSRYYNSNEIGLTHPVTSSTIKLKDNGSIDIFTPTNQGIRIDPNKQLVYTFANNETHNINNLKVNANNNINLESKQQVYIKAFQLITEIRNIMINSEEFKLYCNNLFLDCNSINVTTGRDNVTIGGITMQDMDNRIFNIESNIQTLNNDLNTAENNINQTNNNLSSSNNNLSNHIVNTQNTLNSLQSQINDIWNAINNMNSGE